ncbi:MAG: methyltransferase regulatory domain-containing protein [Bdellovibrionales bacterium]
MESLPGYQCSWGSGMKPLSTFSPISLRYIAALRGNRPKKTGVEFAYADVSCSSPENFICLAASNPEGRFYGFVPDDTARQTAEEAAAQRGTFNVIFLTGTPSEILARIANGSSLPPMLDYLCCDESVTPLIASERSALFDLAQKRLNPGGLFVSSYRAYDREDGALRFLVQELAPEMDSEQKQDFLTEIKTLGSTYFARHSDTAKALDQAIAKNAPRDFFSLYDGTAATSKTFDTMVAAGSHGLLYAGDAILASNYVELAIPHEAQDLVVSCRNSPLYEPIKDFTLDRAVRQDIWIKAPCEQSVSPAELFGGFAYGIVLPREQIPTAYTAKGKTIDLSSPLYDKLLNLMVLMPIGVGDVLVYPSCRGEEPEKILEAFQLLVACGFASPMRGVMTSNNNSDVSQSRLVGNYNRFLDKTSLTDQDVLFASQVTGCGVVLPAREAFVMQAINRVGLNDSVAALMMELQRIAHTPAALSIIETEEPTAEIAHAMIIDIVGKSLPQWYAYALLEAA